MDCQIYDGWMDALKCRTETRQRRGASSCYPTSFKTLFTPLHHVSLYTSVHFFVEQPPRRELQSTMAESRLSADRLNEERAFIRRYTEGLTSHKVEYPADFSTPLEHRPRKVTVVQVR